MSKLVAACVQLTSKADVHANLEASARLAGEAKARGAELVVLPENFAFMGEREDQKFAVAEVVDDTHGGPILAALKGIARANHQWVFAGGMPEKSDRDSHVHNSCVVVDPEGRIAARYRKIHLFDVAIPGGAEFQESRTVAPGREVETVETPWGKVGLSICYDVRFPELYRALGRAGARIMIVPAAFTLHTGKDHWHTLLRARAIENQVYLLAAAQFGRHNDKRVTYGHSLIVDPWGTVLGEAADREGIVVAELDFAWQDKVRRELPALTHCVL